MTKIAKIIPSLLSFLYWFSGWIPLCSENILGIISILLNLLRFYDLRCHLSWLISGGAGKMCILYTVFYNVTISHFINKKNYLTYSRISFIPSQQKVMQFTRSLYKTKAKRNKINRPLPNLLIFSFFYFLNSIPFFL